MSDELDDQIPNEPMLSVDDAIPIEEGGPTARKGFSYQDEICVGVLIQMLGCSSLIKVHCETHDDLLLVWEDGGARTAEYVQVKGGEPDKLWSVADLCKSDAGKGSLFEKSLLRDAHSEASLFRLVTLREVVSELKPLTYPLGAVGREPACAGMTTLRDTINTKSPGVVSTKGGGVEFWLENCVWEVRHDEDDVAIANQNALLVLAHAEGHHLLVDQALVLLEELRAMAKIAGTARWIPDKDKKIITRSALRAWWNDRLSILLSGSPAGERLADKLREANATEDVVAAAVDQRRRYAAAVRTSRYMSDDDAEDLQSAIRASMLELRTQYVAGDIDASAMGFLSLCQQKIRLIVADGPDEMKRRGEFASGCMFDIADRCMLRFTRPDQ